MEILLIQAIKRLILPPGLNLLLAFLGLLLFLRWRRLGLAVITVALVSLYIFSTPVTSERLMRGLELNPALMESDI